MMSFYERYGETMRDFIHVHHLIPLSQIGASYKVDPVAGGQSALTATRSSIGVRGHSLLKRPVLCCLLSDDAIFEEGSTEDPEKMRLPLEVREPSG